MPRDLGDAIKQAASVPLGRPDVELIRERGRRRRWRQFLGAGMSALLLLGGGIVFVPGLVSGVVSQNESDVPSDVQPVAPFSPRAGRLVVIDPQHDSASGQVLVIENQSGEVVRRIPTGSSPQVTAAHDSAAVYIASNEGVGQPVLRKVDVSSGKTQASAAVPVGGGFGLVAMSPDTLFPTMSASADGRFVYIMLSRVTAPDRAEYAVATFDASRKVFLPELAAIADCGNLGGPYAVIGSNRLVVFCLETNAIAMLDIDEAGKASTRTISLAVEPDSRTDENGNSLELHKLAGGVVTADGDSAYVVTQAGDVVEVNLDSQTVEREAQLPLSNTEYVALYQVVISATSDALFLGVGDVQEFNRLQSSSIVGFETSTWQEMGSAALPYPGSAVFADPSSAKIFAVDSASGAISVVDTESLDVSRILGPFGRGLTVGEAIP